MSKEVFNSKKLKTRYLVWLYKTTKEQLDKIDRKFTQLEVDRFILKELERNSSRFSKEQRNSLEKYLNDFKEYIAKKETEAAAFKFTAATKKEVSPEYLFLKFKFKAIEKQIKGLLGKKALAEIQDLYEREMLRRIIEEREHK